MGENIRIYRCTECDKMSTSYDWISSHVEIHNGWGPANLFPHPARLGQPGTLDQSIEVIDVLDYNARPASRAVIDA